MSLSKREKTLLVALLIAAAFFAFYKFVYQPKIAKIEAIDAEIAEDEILHARLEKSILGNDDIEASISSMRIKVKEMNRLLPMRVYQEEIILYLEDLFYNHEIKAENISFSTDSLLDESLNETLPKNSVENLLQEYEQGKKQKTLEELKNVGKEIPETDSEEAISIRQFEISIEFSGKYTDIKDFMDKMESNNRLIGIRSLNLMSNEDNISGNMLVSFPFYEDGSLNELIWEIDNSYGKPDLFKKADSNTWVYGYTPDMTEFNRSDFYLFLDPVENVLPTATMGKTPYNYTAIYNNSTDLETIRLLLTNDENSSYFYRYENSESAYPGHNDSLTEFEPANGKVILNVYIRSDEMGETIPGAKLLIDNKSGLPLYIHVIGDNPENPAFEYQAINGTIRETRLP